LLAQGPSVQGAECLVHRMGRDQTMKSRGQTMRRLRVTGRVCALSLVAAALLSFGLVPSAQAVSCSLTATICLSVANPELATQGAGPYGEITITGLTTSWHAVAQRLNGLVFWGNQALGF